MKLFAALRDDTQQGWVWLKDTSLPARSVVKIKNPTNGKTIYCEALQIDDNFLRIYNTQPRITINNPEGALVINGWYRHKLGGISTQSDIDLRINTSNCFWGRLRACTDHPQIIVRVAAWLSTIGLLLGVIGLVLGMKNT